MYVLRLAAGLAAELYVNQFASSRWHVRDVRATWIGERATSVCVSPPLFQYVLNTRLREYIHFPDRTRTLFLNLDRRIDFSQLV